ncbi:MAG: TonB-dependent receptor [Pseudomonadota bacterium]
MIARKQSWLILFVALVCTAGSAWAQDEGAKGGFAAYSLGDLVVAAERIKASEVSISQELSEAEILATNSKTVAEALSHAPGVLVTTNRRNEPTVQIYGMSQEKTLILIDGVPYYETKYRRLNLDQIPADIIAKIEIIKGAPSVLYGANALTGVINVITKKATDTPTFIATGEVSEHDTYRFSLSQGMKVDQVNYWVNYTHRESAAWNMSDDFQPRMGTIINKPGKTVPALLEDGGVRNNSDYKMDTLWARFGWEPTANGEYYLNLHALNAERGMPPNINSEQVFTSKPQFATLSRWGKYNDLGFDLSGRQKVGDKLTLLGKLFYHDHSDDYVSYSDPQYSKEIALSTYQDYFLGGNLVADYELGQGHNLAGSFHYKGDSHKERDDTYLPYAETFSYTGSLGAEYRYTGLPGLTMVAGASYDWFQVDKAQDNQTDSSGKLVRQVDRDTPDMKDDVNPMVGASYTFSDTTRLFGSIARKSRFPTLTELYSSKGGNRGLNPETSVNYTLGVSRQICQDLTLQLSGFYMDVQDWISRDGPYTTNLYRNYGQVSIYGAELGARWQPVKNLDLHLDYTLLQAKDESDGAVTDKVLRVPEFKLDAGASYLFPVVLTKLDLRGLWVGKRYDQLPTPASPKQAELMTEAYFLLNARLSKVFWDHYEVYAAVNNIFDKDYESEVNFPGQGRTLWFGITTRF